MNWQDLLYYRGLQQDERNANRGGVNLRAIASAVDTGPSQEERDAATKELEEAAGGGFFGNMGKAIGVVGDVAAGIGEGIYKGAESFFGGIGNVVAGQVATNERNALTDKLNTITTESNAYRDTLTEADYDKPEVQERLAEYQKRSQEIMDEQSRILNDGRIERSQNTDALSTAAGGAETVLNFTPGGWLRNAARKGTERLGWETAKNLLEGGATSAAANATRRAFAGEANRTAGGALRTMADYAGQGAIYGGAAGAASELRQNGQDTDPGDIWQSALVGGALGGVLGGGASLLDRNVRAGLRQVPGATRDAAAQLTPTAIASRNPEVLQLNEHLALLNQQRDNLIAQGLSENNPALINNAKAYADTIAQRNATIRSITQGGYIRIPGSSPVDDAASGAEAARRQLSGEATPIETTPNPLPTGRQDLSVPERTSQQDVLASSDVPESMLPNEMGIDSTPTQNMPELTSERASQLLLPQGELPTPPSPAQAKRTFKTSGEAREFLNRQRSGQKPINLPANSEDLSMVATRTNPKGEQVPIKNGASFVSKDVMEGVQELAGQQDKFKSISPLTDINTIAENLTRDAGGIQSKAGQVFENIRAKVQAANAQVVTFNNNLRKMLTKEFQDYNFTPEQWSDINVWLNQQTDAKVRADKFQEIINKHGEATAQKAQAMFDEWSPRMREARDRYNQMTAEMGYPDRAMGDLGEFYWPRVYAQPNVKDKLTDVAGSVIDLEKNGLGKTGYNPNTMSGSTTASNMALPGQQRNFNQAPIGSEFSRPTVGFTGFAKSRTAKSPVGQQVNPMEAVAKYLESVNSITVNSAAVHDIRGVQAAIKALQKETGDNGITILSDVLDNVANPLLGKSNEIDRSLAKYHAGQKALEWGGFISKQLSRSQLLGSLRTVLAQTGQIPLMTAEVGPQNALQGLRAMFGKQMDDLMAKSDFLVSNKFMGNESPFTASKIKNAAQRGERATGWAMDATAAAMAKASWSGAYIKATKAGLSGKKAIQEADRIAGKIVGNRTAGLRPSLYESRAAQGIAMYTLDINQMYQATKGYLKDKNIKAIGTLFGAAWAYNLLYEQLTGDPLVADPIAATGDALGTITSDQLYDSEGNPIGAGERLLRAGGRLGGEALAYTPLGNVAGGIYPEEGFKIPFSNDRALTRAELFGNSQIGRYGASAPLSAAFENPLYLLGIPGMGQIQRSAGGLEAYNNGVSITPSGNERFTVEQDFDNYIRALLYGQYQTREGRQYIEDLTRQQQGYSAY